MEGGNTRQRSRPGDNVGTIAQTVRIDNEDYDALVEGIKTTLNNGTARFTMDVSLGTALANKVCQFIQPGTKLTYTAVPPESRRRRHGLAGV